MKIIRRLNVELTKLVGLTILTYTAMITGALAALPREWQLGVPEPVSPVESVFTNSMTIFCG